MAVRCLFVAAFMLILAASVMAQAIASDDFNAGSLDTSKWAVGTLLWSAFDDANVTVTQTGGQLVITPPSSMAGLRIRGIYSVTGGAFSGRRVQAKFVNAIVKAGSFNSVTYFAIVKNDNNNFYAYVEGSNLNFLSKQGGVAATAPMSRPYDRARDRYLKIQSHVTDNAVVLYTSQDTVDWKEFGRFTVTADLTTADWHVEISAGVANVASPAAVTVDQEWFDRPVLANAGKDKTVIVGNSIQLDGTAALGSGISHSWTRISGPNTPTLTNSTTATPTISGTVAGEYVYRDTVTDGASTSTDDVAVGSVTADSRGQITGLDSKTDFIVSPIVAYGSNKTPSGAWFDLTTDRELEYWATSHPANPPRNFMYSTVNVTNGSTALTCQTGSCNFTTTIELNELVYPSLRDYITVMDGATPRYVKVASVTNNTTAVLSVPWAFSTRTGTDWNTSPINPETGDGSQNIYTEASRYDLAEELYKQYWRTGLTKWLTWARKVEDSRIKSWKFDNLCNCVPGGDRPPPYYSEMAGMILRAIDGRPELWDFIYGFVNLDFTITVSGSLGTNHIRAQMTNPGTSYVAAPACAITTTGAGSGATCVATVVGGLVTAVEVTAPGNLYNTITSPPVVVLTGGGGVGAVATLSANNSTGKVIGVNTLETQHDTRTSAYPQGWLAILAVVLPDTYTQYANGIDQASTGTTTDGAAKRATMLSQVEGSIASWWALNQNVTGTSMSPDGSYRWDLADGSQYLYSQPFMDGIAQQALILTYRATSNSAIKTAIFNVVKASVDWTYYAGGYTQTITDFSPKKWKTVKYDAHGGPAPTPTLWEPPWTYGPTNTGQLIEVTNARGVNGFMAGPAAWIYYITGDTNYRDISDQHWAALYAADGETYSPSGTVGDGIYAIGSSPQKVSSKSKEATEQLYGILMTPIYRQGPPAPTTTITVSGGKVLGGGVKIGP